MWKFWSAFHWKRNASFEYKKKEQKLAHHCTIQGQYRIPSETTSQQENKWGTLNWLGGCDAVTRPALAECATHAPLALGTARSGWPLQTESARRAVVSPGALHHSQGHMCGPCAASAWAPHAFQEHGTHTLSLYLSLSLSLFSLSLTLSLTLSLSLALPLARSSSLSLPLSLSLSLPLSLTLARSPSLSRSLSLWIFSSSLSFYSTSISCALHCPPSLCEKPSTTQQ